MLLPILLLSAAGFTVLTTEFVIVGLLPAIARDLAVTIPQAGLLVTLFAFTVAMFGPFLTAYFARFERRKLFITILIMFAVANTVARRLVMSPQRGGGQAQFIPAPVAQAPRHDLAGLLDWARQRLHRSIAVGELASRMAMSERTFLRRFSEATG